MVSRLGGGVVHAKLALKTIGLMDFGRVSGLLQQQQCVETWQGQQHSWLHISRTIHASAADEESG
jgi:hypothetical protein